MSLNRKKCLQHIGLNICDNREIENFYIFILGFEKIKEFELSEEYARKLFDINRSVPVTLLAKQDFYLELFEDKRKQKFSFEHICINVDNREDIIKMAKQKKYDVTIVRRKEKDDLVFIEDKSGNKFEIIKNKKNIK